jgi:endonuclease-3
MARLVTDFQKLIARLGRHYGSPERPPAKTPFELVIWEHSCYLLPDDRRAAVFDSLRRTVGIDPHKILAADPDVLLELAKPGGMRPDTRVLRWTEISQITVDEFDGDLNRILELPYAQAKKALKLFPSIGDPGAEKILLFCGVGSGLPLESNGCRVLVRLGFGRENAKNYAAQYRSIQDALEGELPKRTDSLLQAHLLLRRHGQEICHTNGPDCGVCPVVGACRFPK